MKILDRLKRPVRDGRLIAEIDGLRFFAIITVMIFHLNTTLSRTLGVPDLAYSELSGTNGLANLGWWLIRMDLGVKVFFAISGFVLSIPFIRQKGDISLKDYYLRRLTRLEPPFIISLLIFFAVHIIQFDAPWPNMLYSLFLGLVYSHVIVTGTASPINPVTWSLETEAQFYLLFPLIFYLVYVQWFPKPKARYIMSIMVCLVLIILGAYFRSFFLSHHMNHLNGSVISFLGNFATGILFALIWTNYKKSFKRQNRIWDIIGVVSLILIFWFYKPQSDFFNSLMLNAFIFLYIVSVFKGKWHNYFYTRPLIYVIGGMCYSIYLLHYAFFYFVVPHFVQILPKWSYLNILSINILIIIPFTLLISAVFFLLFENPFMNKNWPKTFKVKLSHVIQKIR